MFGARFLRHFEPTSSAATSAGGVQPTPHKLNAAEVESEDVSTSGPGCKHLLIEERVLFERERTSTEELVCLHAQ